MRAFCQSTDRKNQCGFYLKKEGIQLTLARPSLKKWGALLIILLPNLLISLNTYMLQVGLPLIQQDLKASFSEAQLILSGYALGLSATLIVSGKLGDLLGRKKMLAIGVAGFFMTALIGGLAHSASLLILIRLLQGIFGACIQPQVLALMTTTFTKDEQPLVFAIYGAMIGIGFTFGLMLGGLIVHLNLANLGWRNLFFFNLPFCLLILFGLQLIEDKAERAQGALDWFGACLFTSSLLLFVSQLFMIKGSTHPLRHGLLIALALILLGSFIFYETRRKHQQQHLLIDLAIFKDSLFTVGMLTVLTVYISMFSYFFLITYYAQAGLTYSVPQTSLAFLPLGIGFICTSLSSSTWIRKWGNKLLLIGASLMTLFSLLLSLSIQSQASLLAPINLLLLGGYGSALGMTTTPLVGLILGQLPPPFAGVGGAMLNTFMYLANALGVCLISLSFGYFLGDELAMASVSAYQNNLSWSLLVSSLFSVLTVIALLQLTRPKPTL